MVKICILLLVCAAILVFGALGNECAQAGDEVAKKKVDGEKVSWAIVALTRKMQVSDSQRRNKAIAKFIRPYASKHNITVIFFSEVPCPSQTMDSWQKTFEGIAQVKVINTADRAMKTKTNENAAGFGYKYMCKFFSIDLYDYLQDFNYYLRCDTDCFFTDLNYDLFAWAEDNNLGYVNMQGLSCMFRGLLLFTVGTLESPDLLLPHSMINLAWHNTIILIKPILQPLNQLIQVRVHSEEARGAQAHERDAADVDERVHGEVLDRSFGHD